MSYLPLQTRANMELPEQPTIETTTMTIAEPSLPLFFGESLFDTLGVQAKCTARRRKNFDFHAFAGHPAQRFLNAIEPGSYFRPHRHLEPLKDETFVILRGAVGILLFDDAGEVTEKAIMRAHGTMVGANVPGRMFHSLVCLEPGSILFESKAGPYDPATDKDWAPWAPADDTPGVPAYLSKLRAEVERDEMKR